MKILTPRKTLNKAFLKQKINRREMERFKTNLQKMLSDMNSDKSEEYHKNLLNTFLNDTWYKGQHFINTRERTDLVIHSDKKPESAPAVVIETKKPGNQTEMPIRDNPDSKAMHELTRYYLHERIDNENIHIKHLVVTDLNDWFVFDENEFDRYVYRDKQVVKDYKEQKQHSPSADTSALEAEIDEMVYDLYGLTEEEGKIVEDGVGHARTNPNPCFRGDFIDNQVTIDNRKIKVILTNSKIPQFRQYPETFVHIITRKSHLSKKNAA